MTLLVYIRDGRTVFRISGRGWLAELTRREPFNETTRTAEVDRGVWNPTTGEYVWMSGIKLRFLAKGSISHVEEDRAEAA